MPEVSHPVLPAEPYEDLAAYEAAGGGQGLRIAVEAGPEAAIAEVEGARLRGRGGAGFPTGRKWRSVLAAAGSGGRSVVCNAAEGEPATYKDRTLLLANPYQVLEGLLIAAHAVDAGRAVIGVKDRHDEVARRVEGAASELAQAGWHGAEAIQVVRGPDEYLYGEESAMLEVIEGKSALPRVMPPYERGLDATVTEPRPSVVNNAETLAHVASILRVGGDVWDDAGTAETPGSMLFTVVGDVVHPGVYELPMGTSLRTLVEGRGGATDVQLMVSGVSQTVITPGLLDLPMDFDSFAEADSGLGSGGFAVYSHERDPVQVCAALTRFLADSSCGQCLACKLGTTAMSDHLDRLVAGRGTQGDLTAISRRTETVTDANRCYLPVGGALLVRSFLETFRTAFEARIGSASTAPPVVAPAISALRDGQQTFAEPAT